MPTTPADPPPRRRRSRVRRGWPATAVVGLVLTLGACSSAGPEGGAPDPSTQSADDGESAAPTEAGADPGARPLGQGGLALTRARRVVPRLDRALAARSEALLAGDRGAFAATLDLADTAFTTLQGTYFDSLAQLPLASLEIRALPSSVVREGDDYWAVVEVSTLLDGFDEAPVLTRDRYRFSPGPAASGGELVVSSVDDPAWEASAKPWSQPWDDGDVAVQVRRADGVLGVFDEQSVGAAGPLMAAAQRALADVDGVVPYPWNGTVVLYALSTTDFLTSIEPPLGGVPERLDGLAFTQGEGTTARVALHPRMLEVRGPVRDRLLRHEITHVAVGVHDDDAPVWLGEGLAEWVSVQPLPLEQRRIARAAVQAATARTLTDLPADTDFAEDDEVGYAVSWWACEALASTLGAPGLWALLDELDAAGAAVPAEAGTGERAAAVDARLESLTGFNRRALARQAAKLIRATYATGGAPGGGSGSGSEGDLPDTARRGTQPAAPAEPPTP